MEPRDNLNFKIENGGNLLGGLISKFSLICFIGVEVFTILGLLIPLLFASTILTALIVSGVFTILNIICAVKLPFMDVAFYETFNHFIKYKLDIQEVKSNNLIKSNLKFEDQNTFIFQYENKLLFKSYFEISANNISATNTELLIADWETILQENNIRIFSINSSFQVEDNINKFAELINNEIDFSKDKDEILTNNKNKLLLQQLADFTILNESVADHTVNVIEFNREYVFDSKTDLKNFIQSTLSTYQLELNAFRTNLLTTTIKELNPSYLNAVKTQILKFDNKHLKIKPKYIEETSNNKTEYYKFIKVNQFNSLLEPYYLYDLFNNEWKFEVNTTFTSLTDKDEDRVYENIENSINSKFVASSKKSKRKKRSSLIRREQIATTLQSMLEEIETSDNKSKAFSTLIKIKADNPKELIKITKEFKYFFKKKRIRFTDLLFLQKNALIDFHIGCENRLNKKGKERKQWIIKRKFNNVNNSTLWLTSLSCSYALPIKTGIDIEPSGWIYAKDLNQNPIAIDFDINRPNHHIAIFGKSGSGKTTATEYLLNQKLVKVDHKDPVVIIIDPKNEYANIVEEYGGQTFDLAEGFANPFKRNEVEDTKKDREFVSQFLFGLLKPLKEIETNLVVVNLLQMIFFSKEWKENKYSFDNLIHSIKSSTTFKEKMKDKYYIVYDYLAQYGSNGIKYHLFNSKVGINFNKKIISFNFEKLIGDDQNNDTSVLIFSVMNFINNLMKQNDPKFKQNQKYNITIIVDEFHLLVNADNTLIIKQFDTLYAISRSYGVGIITITQNLTILNNPNIAHHSRSIFSNATYLISFIQSKDQFEHFIQLIPEDIEINDYEKQEIISDKKHQSILFYGKQKKFMKWKLGLFYDESRDENADGFKSMRKAEYKYLEDVIKHYIELRRGELNAK